MISNDTRKGSMTSAMTSDYPQHQRGADAESAAARYLQAAGLELLERNFSCKLGELDLIMRDGAYIVFVEVRYRSNNRFGNPLETVTATKQRKLKAAAQVYLKLNSASNSASRFDVVGMLGAEISSDSLQINWCKNAF